ncbi:hypothetical protein EDD21DRAFT_372102 [Dissophora ornata]|nr:hypothetical protein EDD21DRAFT_372102 [Dissophora ornata]
MVSVIALFVVNAFMITMATYCYFVRLRFAFRRFLRRKRNRDTVVTTTAIPMVVVPAPSYNVYTYAPLHPMPHPPPPIAAPYYGNGYHHAPSPAQTAIATTVYMTAGGEPMIYVPRSMLRMSTLPLQQQQSWLHQPSYSEHYYPLPAMPSSIRSSPIPAAHPYNSSSTLPSYDRLNGSQSRLYAGQSSPSTSPFNQSLYEFPSKDAKC